MTIRQIISAMLRRWYIPLGLLVCAALVTVVLARDGGIYTTRTVVWFMYPASTALSPNNGTNDSSIIAFAASVAQEVNNGRLPARYSTADAPYYGAGIREGTLVGLTNSGNQWELTFNQAEIEIQVVGRTLDWVESRQQELIGKVLVVAESQQAAVEMAPENRITASVVPLTTEIEYVAPSRTSQLAAGGAMFAAAMITAGWGSVLVDRLSARRRAVLDPKLGRWPGRVVEG